MDLYEAILTTRAIRRFTDEPVTDDEILTCLRAAVQAPSGGNIQPWQFLVRHRRRHEAGDRRPLPPRLRPLRAGAAGCAAAVPRRRRRGRVHAHRSQSSRHLAEHLGEAPALVLFLMPDISMTLHDDDGPLDVGTPYASVYPAVQNFMLAARGLGIGTTLTTVFRIHHDELRGLCGIPDRLPGRRARADRAATGRFGVARRRPAEPVTHWNRYGERR